MTETATTHEYVMRAVERRADRGDSAGEQEVFSALQFLSRAKSEPGSRARHLMCARMAVSKANQAMNDADRRRA
jgi:hypothetical protein